MTPPRRAKHRGGKAPPRAKTAAPIVPAALAESLRKRDVARTWLERNAKLAVTVGGAITALGIIFNFALPIINSHLPSASQMDLTGVSDRITRELNSLDLRQSQSLQRGQTLSDKLTSQQIRYLNDRIRTLRFEIEHLAGAHDVASVALRASATTELESDEAELRKAVAGQ